MAAAFTEVTDTGTVSMAASELVERMTVTLASTIAIQFVCQCNKPDKPLPTGVYI